MLNYKVVIDVEAQAWLDQQPEDVRERVLLVINAFAQWADRAGAQLQGSRWLDPEWGWAKRFKMVTQSGRPVRIIYYVYAKGKEVIISKIAYREEDPYENGN